MLDVAGDRVFERKELWLAVIDGKHVCAERGLQSGVLVEVVDDDLGIAVTLEVDDHAGIFGALIAHIADTGEDFFIREVRDALHEFRAVHIVGDFGDDDLLASALDLCDPHASAHTHGASTSLEI